MDFQDRSNSRFSEQITELYLNNTLSCQIIHLGTMKLIESMDLMRFNILGYEIDVLLLCITVSNVHNIVKDVWDGMGRSLPWRPQSSMAAAVVLGDFSSYSLRLLRVY